MLSDSGAGKEEGTRRVKPETPWTEFRTPSSVRLGRRAKRAIRHLKEGHATPS
jgi:hypothetical protein